MLMQLIPTISWYMGIYQYRWIYKQHFCGHLSRLCFNRLNPSPALVRSNGWSHASHTASRKPSPVSYNAMQVLSFYFSLNDLISKQNHCLTSSEMIVLCMFFVFQSYRKLNKIPIEKLLVLEIAANIILVDLCAYNFIDSAWNMAGNLLEALKWNRQSLFSIGWECLRAFILARWLAKVNWNYFLWVL